jgi:ABC-type dipeptide/oligopeptide/nickel transport system ATPase component
MRLRQSFPADRRGVVKIAEQLVRAVRRRIHRLDGGGGQLHAFQKVTDGEARAGREEPEVPRIAHPPPPLAERGVQRQPPRLVSAGQPHVKPANPRRAVRGVAEREASAAQIAAVELAPGALERPARTLSGGNQQTVVLARLLHQDAAVLLLDEPTRGIDVMSKAQIYEWMGRAAAGGKGLLFVSSYFPELLGVCDRIVVFHRGRVVADRPAAEWTDESLMAASMTGKA